MANGSTKPPETITNTPPSAPSFRAPTFSEPAVRPAPTARLLPNGAIKNREIGFSKQERWFNRPPRQLKPPRTKTSRSLPLRNV